MKLVERVVAAGVVGALTAGAPDVCATQGEEKPPAATAPSQAAAKAPPAHRLENGSFTATLNGFKIHYEIHGRGPVLMTLPNSWGLSLGGLRALYRQLEEHLTLVYFDPRGMGASEADREPADRGMAAVRADFHALRRHLGLGPVNVVGWSNGAVNLIHLASEEPGALSAAVFLHGTPRMSREDQAQIAERYPELVQHFVAFGKEMQAPGLSDGQKDVRQKEFSRDVWFPQLFASPDFGRAKLQEIYKDVGFSWRHAEYMRQESPGLFDWRDRLAEITARSLVIAGRHDMLPAERAREIHAGIPGSRFVVFEKSGHFAPLEEPAAFADAVWGFLGADR